MTLETKEILQDLRSINFDDKKFALKRTIAMMSSGKNVSNLFPGFFLYY